MAAVVGLQLRVGRVFQAEEKARRLRHGLNDQLRTFHEVSFRGEERLVALLFTGIERTPKGLQAELADKFRPAGEGWLTSDQAPGIPSAQRAQRDFLGRRAVRFNQDRVKALGLDLIPKTVDEIFGRKAFGGGGRRRPEDREPSGCIGCGSDGEARSGESCGRRRPLPRRDGAGLWRGHPRKVLLTGQTRNAGRLRPGRPA